MTSEGDGSAPIGLSGSAEGVIPYRCTECGIEGVKLWRQYQTFADHIRLLCAAHACKDQGVADTVGEDGRIEDEHGRHDQIKWLVPAVPTDDGQTFWGYTSVPDEGVKWWHALPTRGGKTQ